VTPAHLEVALRLVDSAMRPGSRDHAPRAQTQDPVGSSMDHSWQSVPSMAVLRQGPTGARESTNLGRDRCHRRGDRAVEPAVGAMRRHSARSTTALLPGQGPPKCSRSRLMKRGSRGAKGPIAAFGFGPWWRPSLAGSSSRLWGQMQRAHDVNELGVLLRRLGNEADLLGAPAPCSSTGRSAVKLVLSAPRHQPLLKPSSPTVAPVRSMAPIYSTTKTTAST